MDQETIDKVRVWMMQEGIDAFLVTQPHNRSYLSGWLEDEADAGLLLIGRDQQFLLTNPLYAEVAARHAIGWQVVVSPDRDEREILISLAREKNWQKIGFEVEGIRYATYIKYDIASKGVFTLQPILESAVDTLRLIKQPREIALLRHAIAITDATFAHICQWIQPGMTERAVEWEISRTMVELEADGPAFKTIVASGPNGSMPHAVAGQRRIQRGELITIDMGARYQGYCADMTRTICLGEPAEARMREMYDVVLLAMKTCQQRLHAGMSGREADALARDVLAQAGLAEYFVHSTGHGVGLQVHERPLLSQRVPDYSKIPAGCVVTIEPGVYISGYAGTRVENCVLVREDSIEVLTQSTTELVIR